MPNLQDLATTLSGIRTNNRDQVNIISWHLVSSAIKGQSNNTKIKREKLVKESADRLWNNYMLKRLDKSVTTREAAQDAILDEQYTLEEEVKKALKGEGC